MDRSFKIDLLLKLAKLGADKVQNTPALRSQIRGIMPGSQSDTWDDIEQALCDKFPDGIILPDIS